MVYYLSVSNPYPEEITTSILDDPRPHPLTLVDYADPAMVDEKSLEPGVERMKRGYRVRPASVPGRVLWESAARPLPDVISHQEVIIAGDRFRALVEQFEPGLHQFIPVDVHVPGQDAPVARYHWLVVTQRVDSVDREHTTYQWKLDSTGRSGFWSKRGLTGAKMVFSKAKVAGHHIWVDPHVLVMNCGLCSNDFANAALAAQFSGLNVTPRDEV